MRKYFIVIIVLALAGCSAYNPYQQPHFDWRGVPALVPLEQRQPVDASNMCLGRVA